MDKNAIKKYAVWARNELIARVTQKAEQYEIMEKKITPDNADSINGRLLTEAEKNQRKALINKIQSDGFEQVMEEVAYTWFNRFTALRFMEVNNYLPSHIRVFTNEAGEFKPQILIDAIQLELDGLDMDKVYEMKDANKTEELFKYLLITQCNALSSILPGMFQKIEDYTELLLPDYLLRESSVIEQLVTMIPEEDWTDQVQIIGWLYQYYNTEPKDKVFADLKKNIKISKENIPAATQLFTPDWIVHYMVENSLGRLWLEGHPDDALKSEWKYFLDEAEQVEDVQTQLDMIRKKYVTLKPEEIRCIDPCMGSGHILCVLFDILVRIYEDYGYSAMEAVTSIVENNLWGLDIDERAAQLSYFAVMMKARQYDRRFFNKKDENGELDIPQPHVYAIEESNGITSALMYDMGLNLTKKEYDEAFKLAMRLVEEMHDAKEYGSIIHVTPCDWDLLRRFAVPRDEDGQMYLDIHGEIGVSTRLQKLINIGEVIAQKYDVVVTNPPYMGSSGMNDTLSEYVKKNYFNTKSDLFACFIDRGNQFVKKNGYNCMVTMQSWMFLSSFEKMRNNILYTRDITNLMHMENMVMGIAFGTAVTVFRNGHTKGYKGTYSHIKLSDIEKDRPREFPVSGNRFAQVSTDNFSKIPGSPVAYWVSNRYFDLFLTCASLIQYADIRQGMKTADNDTYLRRWFEIPIFSFCSFAKTSSEALDSCKKWFPYNKGGDFRKWYGNREYVVNWQDNGVAIKNYSKSVVRNEVYYFREGLTWSLISSSNFGIRYTPCGAIFDGNGSSMFVGEANLYELLGFMTSCVAMALLKVLSPTMTFEIGQLSKLPYIPANSETVRALVSQNIDMARTDWDSFEASWDFQCHPLVRCAAFSIQEMMEDAKHHILDMNYIEEAFVRWSNECYLRFEQLKTNEEELNRIFIDIYGLQNELSPEVEDKDITVRKADLGRDIRSLISYAVGCMFGRYSLDVLGLAYAGGTWDASKYTTFLPNKDAIIPICDDEYFENDVVVRFVEFIEAVYGKEALEENLQFIAQALGGKGASREVIRNYFMNDFYIDHLKIYQKRPIYWLFDSGKRNGFKCLVYMHRYQPDTIARIRTDYVHEQQSRYRTAIADLEQRVGSASTSEGVKLNKQLLTLQAQAEEIRIYEEKIHHLADQMVRIDLDDGVKHNYEIFKDVLAKIK